jgi:membrane-associated protease RseP (regulator of RpoE activity)
VFVAFTGEEAGRLGSQHYIRHATRYPADRMVAMINLDTVGRLGERPLLALGTGTAREWSHILRGAGYVTGVPVTPVADDIGSSDQTSFIAAGVPAVQLFSGAHADFHRPGDTPDRIDAAGLVKTAQVLKEIAVYLAARPEALHSDLGQQQLAAAAPAQEKKRRVSVGLTPDYAFEGEGVRIDALRSGTPASRSGLRPGDIITALNDAPVPDLRAYAQLLKGLQAGDTVRITFRRGAGEHSVTTRVIER